MTQLNKQQHECAIIAIEEMAELTQVLTKMIRFGYTNKDTEDLCPIPDSLTRLHLVQEIGDVRCMIKLLHNTFGIDYSDTDKAIEHKQNKLMKWSSLYE